MIEPTQAELTELQQYKLEPGNVEPAAWEAYVAQGRTPEALSRIVRLTAVNMMMLANGLEPLLLGDATVATQGPGAPTPGTPRLVGVSRSSVERDIQAAAGAQPSPSRQPQAQQQPPDDTQMAIAVERLGLSAEEFECIRGDFGEVCGLRVNKATYSAVLRICSVAQAKKSIRFQAVGAQRLAMEALRRRARRLGAHVSRAAA